MFLKKNGRISLSRGCTVSRIIFYPNSEGVKLNVRILRRYRYDPRAVYLARDHRLLLQLV